MFKKHEFTCPDVIYLRNHQKKFNRISIAVQLSFLGALWLYGYIDEKKEAAAYDEHVESLVKDEE